MCRKVLKSALDQMEKDSLIIINEIHKEIKEKQQKVILYVYKLHYVKRDCFYYMPQIQSC